MEQSLKQRLVARFRGNRLLSHMLRITGRDLKPDKWVFIVGCYNSGTTLLDDILSRHPLLGGLNDEGVMLTDKLPRPEDFGWRRMWWKCESAIQVPLSEAAGKAAVIKKHWSHFYRQDRSILVEKSISNAARMEFFNDNFSPAYFIHIVRNGYAAIEGIKRKTIVMGENAEVRNEQYPIDYCATQWKRSIDKVDEQSKKMDHFIEITYEDLTENTKKTMQRITRFIGVPDFADSVLNSEFNIHGKESEIRNMNGSSIKNLSKQDFEIINSIAGAQLARYNYLIQP